MGNYVDSAKDSIVNEAERVCQLLGRRMFKRESEGVPSHGIANTNVPEPGIRWSGIRIVSMIL